MILTSTVHPPIAAPVVAHPPAPSSPSSPDVNVATLIGAAQGQLSLGLTSVVPGVQTLNNAMARGPANKVPPSVISALQAYIQTPQCQITISDARLVAEFTIARMKAASPLTVAAPKLSSQATQAQVVAAAGGAATQMPTRVPQVGVARTVEPQQVASTALAIAAVFFPEIAIPVAAFEVSSLFNAQAPTAITQEQAQALANLVNPQPEPADDGQPGIIQQAVGQMLSGSGGDGSSNTTPAKLDDSDDKTSRD